MRPHRERGVTLLLGVLLLATLSLVVLSAASASGLQIRISNNNSQEQQALAQARSASHWAERWLLGQPGTQRLPPCAASCTAQQVVRAAGSYPPLLEHQSEAWWLTHGHADGFDPASGQRLAQRTPSDIPAGRWLIEEVHHETSAAGSSNEISYYRILARGVAASGGPPVVVESIIARPWGQADWQDPLPRESHTVLFCHGLLPATPCGRRSWQRRL